LPTNHTAADGDYKNLWVNPANTREFVKKKSEKISKSCAESLETINKNVVFRGENDTRTSVAAQAQLRKHHSKESSTEELKKMKNWSRLIYES
jgi:hypothetical protein